MPWPQTDTTHYNSQLGSPDKDHAIKGLVVYYIKKTIHILETYVFRIPVERLS